MKTLDMIQGSPEWHAHRAVARNASEAPIMMGSSKKAKRSDMVRLKAAGIEREYSRWVEEVLFARGHEVEPDLRAMAEKLIGDDLFPVVGVSDDGYLSASYDGVSIDGTIICECKQPNAGKIAALQQQQIPSEDYWQIVQQFAVCETARKCIYVIGDGTEEGSHTLEILRARIESDIPSLIAGWKQLDEDIASYKPTESTPVITATPTASLPVVSVQMQGAVAIVSNLDLFGERLRHFIAGIDKAPNDDQGFVDGERAVKVLKEAEEALTTAEETALAQTASIEELRRTCGDLRELARSTRLALEKIVKNRKEEIKTAEVMRGRNALADHVAALNARLGKPYMPAITADFALAIKGLKSLASVRDAIDTALAAAKIEASAAADRIDANLKTLRELAMDHAFLFADTAQIVLKANDDLTALIKSRIAEHDAEQNRKLEAERARIRAEEEARAQREAEAKAEDERRRIREEERQRAEAEATQHQPSAPAANTSEAAVPTSAAVGANNAASAAVQTAGAAPTPADTGARIKLGEINARIAPLSITAEGLASLGFQSVGTERAAKLYRATDFPRICSALISHLQRAQTMKEAA